MEEKSKNPIVSIVLPVHNGELYIKESIDSCLNQTFKDFELIIVNDESTDNSSNILEEYLKKDQRIKVLNIKKQNSLADVLNEGIKISKGKYIARIDADDFMYPTRLEKHVEFLESNPEVVVVGGQIDIIDQNSQLINHRKYALEDSKLRKNIFLFQPFAHPAIMMRKDVLESVGLYPTNSPKVEDTKLMFLLSQKGKFANLPDTVIKYRVTYNTESQKNMINHFRLTNEARNWAIKKLGIKPSFRELILWNIQKVLVYILSFLPNNIFFKVFELGRSIIK